MSTIVVDVEYFDYSTGVCDTDGSSDIVRINGNNGPLVCFDTGAYYDDGTSFCVVLVILWRIYCVPVCISSGVASAVYIGFLYICDVYLFAT